MREPEFLAHLNRPVPVLAAEGVPPSPIHAMGRGNEVVYTIPKRGRSLAMQVRFFRSLVFAARLFAHVLWWYYIMPKIVGQDAVDRGSDQRFVMYARHFRNFAIVMGGVMIKLGQFVSTRVDVLPEDITNELAGLQDEVPSIPNEKIREVVRRELGSIEKRFVAFAEEPIAAASLGQVYRAKLHNGDKVVVKVQRPGIREVVYTDLAALRIVALVANRFSFIRRRADMRALTEEFGRVLLEEVSYLHEAQNAARFAAMFKDDLGIYIPHVYPEHSTDSVLVIEDVTTIKISDYAALEAAGINRNAVAKRLMDCYMKQVFEERFFHADPHPGNLFVYPLPEQPGAKRPKTGREFYLIFIDFGMIGTLTPQITTGLINTLTAIVTRDAAGLVKSYEQLGFLMPGADTERIIEATKATFDQVWGLSMTEIKSVSFTEAAELGKEFNDLIYSMPFQVPQDFIYLGRAMGILSGMATSLDQNFNPWSELQPYAQKMIAMTLKEGATNGAAADVLGFPVIQGLFNGNAPRALLELGRMFVSRAVAVPQQLDNVLGKLDKGELTVRVTPTAAYRVQLQRIENQGKRTTRAVVFAGALIASTLFYTNGDMAVAVVGFVISGITLIGLWWGPD